jgi:hypothetical protein
MKRMFFNGLKRPNLSQQRREIMLDTVRELLGSRKIPPLDAGQMSAVLSYLFSTAEKGLRIQVAEVVYRHDHDHPNALDLFLACTLPLADATARRQGTKLFARPCDMTIELLYDGAVNAAIRMFQKEDPCKIGHFRRALYRALRSGALRTFFNREENRRVLAVGCSETVRVRNHRRPQRHTLEDVIISRELLEKIASLKPTPSGARRILQCIMEMGPDAVKPRSNRDPEGDIRRPLIDIIAVGEAMGITRKTVDKYLGQARAIVRQTFNPDGRLFLAH